MGQCSGKCVSAVNTVSELLKKLDNIEKALEQRQNDTCPKCNLKRDI